MPSSTKPAPLTDAQMAQAARAASAFTAMGMTREAAGAAASQFAREGYVRISDMDLTPAAATNFARAALADAGGALVAQSLHAAAAAQREADSDERFHAILDGANAGWRPPQHTHAAAGQSDDGRFADMMRGTNRDC